MLRRVCAGIMLLSFTACSTVQPVSQPQDFIQSESPDRVFVWDGEELLVLDTPELQGDQIIGIWPGTRESFSVPLSDVKEMRASQPNGTRTAILGVGLAAFAGTITYLLTRSSTDDPTECVTVGGNETPDCEPVTVPIFQLRF